MDGTKTPLGGGRSHQASCPRPSPRRDNAAMHWSKLVEYALIVGGALLIVAMAWSTLP
jgi:hypothetical protein